MFTNRPLLRRIKGLYAVLSICRKKFCTFYVFKKVTLPSPQFQALVRSGKENIFLDRSYAKVN